MTLQAGEVWLADIPFTHGKASKVRPVLILWLDGMDAVVAAITSTAPRSTTDVPVADWKAAGLRAPSTVRLSRLDCLEQPLLFRQLGALSSADKQTIKNTWDLHVKPQF
jgi:mRNA interferase MazF